LGTSRTIFVEATVEGDAVGRFCGFSEGKAITVNAATNSQVPLKEVMYLSPESLRWNPLQGSK
jgi:hypothetical protein